MWKIIQFTNSRKNKNINQIIDNPINPSIPRNGIRGNKDVIFKTLDNLTLIEKLAVDRNVHRLYQVQELT